MNTLFSKWGFKTCQRSFKRAWELFEGCNLTVSRTYFLYGIVQVRNVHHLSKGSHYKVNRQDLELVLGCRMILLPQSFRLLTTSRNRCWKCNAVVTERDLVCLSCGCVQEPKQNLNNFEIFKETPHFDVDVRNLTVKYRRLQTMLHPDKFATRSEREKKYSMEQSSRVNKAYQMLYHPLERGLYLLEIYDKPLLEGDITMPSDFLQDIMEIHEELVESNSPEIVESARHVNNAKLEVLFAELSQAFKEKNIDRARELLAKLKYYVSIGTQIKKKEDELGITRDD